MPSPTCSPLYSIGARSFSPSPMTTTPFIDTVLISKRIACTAARVRAVLVAAADPAGGGHRAGLGDPGEFQGQVPVGRPPAGFRRDDLAGFRAARQVLGHDRSAFPGWPYRNSRTYGQA